MTKYMILNGWKTSFGINNEAYHKFELDNIWIPKAEMIINGVYLVDGRNLSVGRWNGESFDYWRHKWHDEFEAIEFHWDDGPPHGTVKPFMLIKSGDTGDGT